MRKLLVHACCGPCLIYPHRMLRTENELTIFYFNPNIHPSSEYVRRLETLAGYCKNEGLELLAGEYRFEEYFRKVAFDEKNRCLHCYRLRLAEAAAAAAARGFEAFTTTLTVSPYQDHDALQAIGDEVADAAGVRFVYHDFRSGFRRGQDEAAERGLYRQPYCGCVFSENERYEKRLRRAVGDANAGGV